MTEPALYTMQPMQWWILDIRTKKVLLEDAAEWIIERVAEIGEPVDDFRAFLLHQTLGGVVRDMYDSARENLHQLRLPPAEFNHASFAGYRNRYEITLPLLRKWLAYTRAASPQEFPVFR